jgi:hypothetical protein
MIAKAFTLQIVPEKPDHCFGFMLGAFLDRNPERTENATPDYPSANLDSLLGGPGQSPREGCTRQRL